MSCKWCPGAESNHRHCDFQIQTKPVAGGLFPAAPRPGNTVRDQVSQRLKLALLPFHRTHGHVCPVRQCVIRREAIFAVIVRVPGHAAKQGAQMPGNGGTELFGLPHGDRAHWGRRAKAPEIISRVWDLRMCMSSVCAEAAVRCPRANQHGHKAGLAKTRVNRASCGSHTRMIAWFARICCGPPCAAFSLFSYFFSDLRGSCRQWRPFVTLRRGLVDKPDRTP